MFDKTIAKFIPLNGSLQLKLFKMVLQKQLHECQNQCIRKGWMEIASLDVHFCHILKPNLLWT